MRKNYKISNSGGEENKSVKKERITRGGKKKKFTKWKRKKRRPCWNGLEIGGQLLF